MAGLDAIAELREEAKNLERLKAREKFSFSWLAGKVRERQLYNKDCIIIVTGDRRMGKSNWSLKLIRAYIKLRLAEKGGHRFKWSWKENFPKTRSEAMDAASELEESYVCHDEGGEQFYRQETNVRVQRELVKFMNKCGMKRNLTIINWPDPYTLDPKIVNMATLLVIVPYRYRELCAFAFIYGRSNNPLNYDKFGIEKIRKRMLTTKAGVRFQLPTMSGKLRIIQNGKTEEIPYPKELFKFLRSMPTFLKSHRFTKVEKRFEDAYIRNVKEFLLDARGAESFVSSSKYEKLRLQYDTLLYNLYTKDDKSYAQLERLHVNHKGQLLRSNSAIRSSINRIKAIS